MNMKKKASEKSIKGVFIAIAVVGVIVVIFTAFAIIGGLNGRSAGNNESISENVDLVIPKSEITDTVKFYPYTLGKTKMEVMAVKAPDGSVRTALNTCQVCYDSGRGYYEQQGDRVICQNCGNQFKISEIEKIKGGCNPVPVLEENKSDDGANITISKAFLEQSKILFTRWKVS